MCADNLQYAGFWRRFAALLLDVLVLAPYIAFLVWAQGHYRLFPMYWLVPAQIFSLWYGVYLVRRYGGTPGKLIMGIRITKLNGASVTYREAFLRYAPEFILCLPITIGLVMALLQVTDAEYAALSVVDRAKRLDELAPQWYWPSRYLLNIWTWGELFVLLTNRKKRALHDFIAGTVVVLEKSQIVQIPEAVAPPNSG